MALREEAIYTILLYTSVLTLVSSKSVTTNDVLFSLNWQELREDSPKASDIKYETVTIKTVNNETYICQVPIETVKMFEDDTYVAFEAIGLNLLAPLLKGDPQKCWVALADGMDHAGSSTNFYQLCGGRHAHLLTRGNERSQNLGSLARDPQDSLMFGQVGRRYLEFNGLHRYPFVALQLDGGDPCLAGGVWFKASTIVFFRCGSYDGITRAGPELSRSSGKATCRHLIAVATPLLCAHPAFRPKRPRVNSLACRLRGSVDGNSLPPQSLMQMESDRDMHALASLLSQMGSGSGNSRVGGATTTTHRIRSRKTGSLVFIHSGAPEAGSDEN